MVSVEYDCKVATVTTRTGAVLTEPEAHKVIQAAGYRVVSFAVGDAPKRTAFLFRVRAFEPLVRETLENGFRDDLKNSEKVAVDGLGRVAIVVTGDAADAREMLLLSLRKRGVAAEGFETKTWPKLDATYAVAVSGMTGAVEANTVADVLAGVAKVVAVHVYPDAGTATLWLKEPCDALEAKVTAALAAAGFSASSIELKAN